MSRALITGCSTGIGRATAVELTKRGHEVIATARRREMLADLDVAETLWLDVDDDASVSRAVADAGEIDVLVNNAGIGVGGPVEAVPLRDARRMFETNLFGAVRMMQAVLPQMRRRGNGTIVNVSSVAGCVAPPLSGFYAATKAALEAISEALHYEIAHFGVRVAIVEPGYFATTFEDNAREFGTGEPPYDELRRIWDAAQDTLTGGSRPGPEGVAAVIAEAIEAEPPRLRWPAGPDAEMVTAARASMDDETFEATMRRMLGVDW